MNSCTINHTPGPWDACGEPIAKLALEIARGSGFHATSAELDQAAEANKALILSAYSMCAALNAILAESLEPGTRMLARAALEHLDNQHNKVIRE